METNKFTDLTYLKSLSPDNTSFVKEMIEIFLNQTPEQLTQLKNACSNLQWTEVRSVAHAMKSTISFIGIASLSEIIKTIEDNAATESNVDAIPALITKVNEICSASYLELQEELKKIR